MSRPIISIITAVYNGESFIDNSINSVINQSYKNWELLIINDGSTDNTENIIKTYKDPRIKYFYQENQGVSSARNTGLNHMTGDYFCFLDADDSLPSESLEVRYQKFSRNPEIDFLDGAVKIFDQDLGKPVQLWIPGFRGNPLGQLLNLSDSCFFGPNWMIRRNKKKEYYFHEGLSHGEDLLFYLELAMDGGRYDYIEEEVLHYRKGHPSAMNNLSGLENGYHYIYRTLKDYANISTKQLGKFKEKAKSIIFKSYLGNYQFINAFLSWFKKW